MTDTRIIGFDLMWIEVLIEERDDLSAKLADCRRRALLDAAEKFEGTQPHDFNYWDGAEGSSDSLNIASELRHMADQLRLSTPKNAKIEPGEAS